VRAHGAELVGDLVSYENVYRLCYVRGPEGIIVELAQRLEEVSCSAKQPGGVAASPRDAG
jgi:hypothetical protein